MHDLQCVPIHRSLIVIKLDMEYAYDQMSWSFLHRTLLNLGFCDRGISWIMDCVKIPSFAILINSAPMDFFQSTGSLRQGCLLSPYLFILCADVLSRSLRGVT